MLKTLYGSRAGGYVLKIITRPGFSRTCAGMLDAGYSRVYIKRFIQKNAIDMSEYECVRWRSFNEFFTRKIKPSARPVDTDPNALISPCDGLLSAYMIRSDTKFMVKGYEYTVNKLLQNRELAAEYAGGTCLVFRMMPVNYHRYIYPDDGAKGGNIAIPGKLHTVRPVAQRKCSVYTTNSREYTILHTKHFGDIAFIEVGALMVGRIRNLHGAHEFARGEEKGFFEYGGSTIIMLIKKDAAKLDKAFAGCMAGGCEEPVKLGQRIGFAQNK